MKSTLFLLALLVPAIGFWGCGRQGAESPTPVQTVKLETPMPQSVYEFTMKDIDGKDVSLKQYAGKVLVIVNVASKCGYTDQYADLEKFSQEYKDKGVVVLGFPANNFGGQEPGADAEIKQFCTTRFGVTFPMFSKISVKGDDMHPLYAYLTGTLKQDIKWNFNKILIDKTGKPVQHIPSRVNVTDEEFLTELKKLL